ncbi:MAG: hypothetical protein JWM53_5760, partial [bacterium]|nr:hypothetical protein [bacterium]
MVFVLVGLTSAVGFAQRGGGGRAGGGPSGGGRPGPPQSTEDAQRAANAKQWAADIEKIRAQAPPPPLPQIHFPSQNELLLSRLRWAEDPRREVAQYLDKLWKDAKDPMARRIALETFWHDAEKPKWVRPATEAYFQRHADGAALRPPDEPAEIAKPAPATAPSGAVAPSNAP